VELIPEAIVGWPTMLIAAAAFLAIVWWKRDVALVAIGGIVGGVIYAIVTYQ
jgi:ABC-type enterobactin transport system permease subunit